MSDGISVSELNRLISESLRREPRLRNVTVTAEVSGFKHQLSSGHWYFTLKDAQASVACVMFRQNTFHAALKPRDGDQVTVTGYVEIYARDGKVQLYVMSMKAAGSGSLYEQFEALKRKLEAEGLFDPGRKKLLPQIPRKVAVITSASGAALHDILNVSGARNPAIPITLVPCTVQGAGAGKELADAIRLAERIPGTDVIIIGRGGGSQEDLWCFNDEALARAIADCPIPVVSGVGHEVDFTICDFVADVRASTPSNAAEIVFPDRRELRGRKRLAEKELLRAVTERIHRGTTALMAAREKLQLLSPERRILRLTDRAHQERMRLTQRAAERIQRMEHSLGQQRTDLCYRMERLMQGKEFELRRAEEKLKAISPMRVLERGYALVYDDQDRVIPEAGEARRRTEMRLRFRDGEVEVCRKESKAQDGKADL